MRGEESDSGIEGEEKTRWWNLGLSDVPRVGESHEGKDAFFVLSSAPDYGVIPRLLSAQEP